MVYLHQLIIEIIEAFLVFFLPFIICDIDHGQDLFNLAILRKVVLLVL